MGLSFWRRHDRYEELIREVLRVTAQQVEVTNRMAEIFDRMTTLWEPTGPPTERHMSDEIEANILDTAHER